MNISSIDFSPWKDSEDKVSRLWMAQEIADASTKVGFMYIIYHSLPGTVLNKSV